MDLSTLLVAAILIGLGVALLAMVITPTPTTASVSHYNATASPGDFWQMTHDSVARTLTVTNVTAAAAPVVLSYIRNDDDSYDIVDGSGTPRTDYTRFIEIRGYVLMMQTARAGAAEDQHAIVIGVRRETLRVTMTDNPHHFYQFSKRDAGSNAGFVTFLRGKNVSSDEAQWAPTAAPGDAARLLGRVQPGGMLALWLPNSSAAHSYLDEGEGGAMAINFKPAIDSPGPFMTMPYGDGVSTIYGTQSGHFVLDTPGSSILCFDATKTTQTLAALQGDYTVLFEGKHNQTIDFSVGDHGASSGADVQGKGSLDVAEDPGSPGSFNAHLVAGPLNLTGQVHSYSEAWGSLFDFGPMAPTPSVAGMFVMEVGTRGASGYSCLVFSVLNKSIVFQSMRLSNVASNVRTVDFAFGAGVLDV